MRGKGRDAYRLRLKEKNKFYGPLEANLAKSSLESPYGTKKERRSGLEREEKKEEEELGKGNQKTRKREKEEKNRGEERRGG